MSTIRKDQDFPAVWQDLLPAVLFMMDPFTQVLLPFCMTEYQQHPVWTGPTLVTVECPVVCQVKSPFPFFCCIKTEVPDHFNAFPVLQPHEKPDAMLPVKPEEIELSTLPPLPPATC